MIKIKLKAKRTNNRGAWKSQLQRLNRTANKIMIEIAKELENESLENQNYTFSIYCFGFKYSYYLIRGVWCTNNFVQNIRDKNIIKDISYELIFN